MLDTVLDFLVAVGRFEEVVSVVAVSGSAVVVIAPLAALVAGVVLGY